MAALAREAQRVASWRQPHVRAQIRRRARQHARVQGELACFPRLARTECLRGGREGELALDSQVAPVALQPRRDNKGPHTPVGARPPREGIDRTFAHVFDLVRESSICIPTLPQPRHRGWGAPREPFSALSRRWRRSSPDEGALPHRRKRRTRGRADTLAPIGGQARRIEVYAWCWRSLDRAVRPDDRRRRSSRKSSSATAMTAFCSGNPRQSIWLGLKAGAGRPMLAIVRPGDVAPSRQR